MEKMDELTGLPIRAGLLQSLESALAQAARDTTCLTLILLDIDHLLEYNDIYGHQAGDELIQTFVKWFEEEFTAGGVVGRYGGDEFIAAAVHNDPAGLFDKAEAFLRKSQKSPLALHLAPQEHAWEHRFTLGMATYPADAASVDDLIEKAKEAMHRAKGAGGNTVYVYEEKDGLTGLLNHAGLKRKAADTLAQAEKEGEPVSFLMLDIDRFDEMNRLYGHPGGDAIIKRLAAILEANFTGRYYCGRTGGDEFTVVMPGCQADSAFVLAEEVRRLVEDTEVEINSGQKSQAGRFHVSGGVATFPTDAAELLEVIRKADESLYRAKQIGRNRICLPVSAQMITKTSYFTQTQLERLAQAARRLNRTEAFLLREALDDLLEKYDDKPKPGLESAGGHRA